VGNRVANGNQDPSEREFVPREGKARAHFPEITPVDLAAERFGSRSRDANALTKTRGVDT
jgi:hypothetical protein